MKRLASETENQDLSKKTKMPSKKITLKFISYALMSAALVLSGFIGVFLWGSGFGQTLVWDQIRTIENQLRDLYSNSTQTELKAWLPDIEMNFTDGLLWESPLLNFTQDRPQYQNVTQVLKNGKGACGEFVWVFGAFCVAKNIPFRVVTVGYFVPNVVDHSWAQVNPSRDGKTWIHVEVTDSCLGISAGKIIDQLWNVTINNNSYYNKYHYKMVLAYQLNEDNEVVITDVTTTFSQS